MSMGLCFAATVIGLACSPGSDREKVASPIANAATVVVVAADPSGDAVAAEISALMQQLTIELNAGMYDSAVALYSKCSQKDVTAEKLKFGRNATGKVTLNKVSLLRTTGSTATASIETATESHIGTANSFKSLTNFVLEEGRWRIDAHGLNACG
jgi:hypothetical protein